MGEYQSCLIVCSIEEVLYLILIAHPVDYLLWCSLKTSQIIFSMSDHLFGSSRPRWDLLIFGMSWLCRQMHENWNRFQLRLRVLRRFYFDHLLRYFVRDRYFCRWLLGGVQIWVHWWRFWIREFSEDIKYSASEDTIGCLLDVTSFYERGLAIGGDGHVEDARMRWAKFILKWFDGVLEVCIVFTRRFVDRVAQIYEHFSSFRYFCSL